MEKRFYKKYKLLAGIGLVVVVALAIWAGRQYVYLRKAHSTFENYYAFRNCRELIQRTQDYGVCKLYSGKTIKIVKYNNKWYLDGDLPWACLGKVCFGI